MTGVHRVLGRSAPRCLAALTYALLTLDLFHFGTVELTFGCVFHALGLVFRFSRTLGLEHRSNLHQRIRSAVFEKGTYPKYRSLVNPKLDFNSES